MPVSVTRQTFTLIDQSNTSLLFSIAYDPVARVVSILPTTALTPGSTYTVSVSSPKSTHDASGLHAIDGATMDPDTNTWPRSITFTAGSPAAAQPCNSPAGCVDFCGTIKPALGTSCGVLAACHSSRDQNAPPADGLELFGPTLGASLAATAIGRLSIESTMGGLSQPVMGQPSTHFGQDMPIIDAQSRLDAPVGSGDPGNSYLIYKVLMAALPMTGNAPTVKTHLATWSPMSDYERATLSGLIPGREMPFPTQPATVGMLNTGLTVDQLEAVSLWIMQGAPVYTCQ